MKIEIKSWLTGSVLFKGDFSCIADAVKAAAKSSADLSSAVDSWAQVAFMGHGECGRMLMAVRIKKDGEPTFFCGCFTGTLKQLEGCIEEGAPNLKKTRTLAMKAVVEMLESRNEEAT